MCAKAGRTLLLRASSAGTLVIMAVETPSARFDEAAPDAQGRDWKRLLTHGAPILGVVVAILASLLHLPVALVDLEPFDAYLPAVAGYYTDIAGNMLSAWALRD